MEKFVKLFSNPATVKIASHVILMLPTQPVCPKLHDDIDLAWQHCRLRFVVQLLNSILHERQGSRQIDSLYRRVIFCSHVNTSESSSKPQVAL